MAWSAERLRQLLVELGHARGGPGVGRAGSLGEALRRFQRFHRLKVTGKPDKATIRQLEAPRCGLPDVMPLAAGLARWATSPVFYLDAISFPWADPQRVAANYAEAARRLAAACGLGLTRAEVPSQANITATAKPIDGPGNVLALSQIPPADAPAGTRLWQQYDPTERAAMEQDEMMVAVMTHELGHALGLAHLTAGNLMAPVINPAITTLQAGDVAELQARYGPPRPARPPSAPAGEPVKVPVRLADGSTEFDGGLFDIGGTPHRMTVNLRPQP